MPSQLQRDQVQAVQQENCFGKAMQKRGSEDGASQHRKKMPPCQSYTWRKNMEQERRGRSPSQSFWQARLRAPCNQCRSSVRTLTLAKLLVKEVCGQRRAETGKADRLGFLAPNSSAAGDLFPHGSALLTFRERNSVRDHFRKAQIAVLQTLPGLLPGALSFRQCFVTSIAMLFVCLMVLLHNPFS